MAVSHELEMMSVDGRHWAKRSNISHIGSDFGFLAVKCVAV